MRLAGILREWRRPRWLLDTVVCIGTALGLNVYVLWTTRIFETSAGDPSLIVSTTILIVLAYAISACLGSVWGARIISNVIWVPVVGSIIVGLVRLIGALPGFVEYHNRFFPETSIFLYIISHFVWTMLGISLPAVAITTIAVIIVRFLCWLIPSDYERA